ncbi:MAG: MBL fold metallo-hydrolase [Candidatus Nanohaloarchaea archaeon]|nr:MBL fold metallo-hydrolase [Candidatus Nanohaloarchaea archaeon]
MQLTFLGTGGGRFAMIKQLRATGGIYLEHGDFSGVIDPAPGALVRARGEGIDLEDLDAVIVSHAHLDHDGDMDVMIEAMTRGGKEERGTLLCAASVLDGAAIPDRYVEGGGTYGDRVPPSLDTYHESLVPDIVRLEDGTETAIGPFDMRCIETEHSDPRTVAFTLDDGDTTAGFVTDTELFDDLVDFFTDSDVLIVNMMRPHDKEWKGHLNTADAAELLNETEPDYAIMQHFGAALIYSSVNEEAAWLEERTDVEFAMAEDGMTVDLGDRNGPLDAYLNDQEN